MNNTSYTNSNLDDNLYYCYGVSGVNSENAEGSISNIACEITQDQLAATTPSNLNATGGTAEAAAKLIEMSKGKVAAYIFVINLFDLGGCDNLIKEGFKVENLIEFPGH